VSYAGGVDAQRKLSQRERASGLERSDFGREESQGSGKVCGNCGIYMADRIPG